MCIRDRVNNQDEMIVEVELSDLSTDNYIELQKISKAITKCQQLGQRTSGSTAGEFGICPSPGRGYLSLPF